VEPLAFKKYEFMKHWFGFSYCRDGVRPDGVDGPQLAVNGKQQGRFLALP
jgi:hypothetical protein